MKRKFASCLLAAVWTFSHVAGFSSVFCIGDNGTVSVEPLIANKCVCTHEAAADWGDSQFKAADKYCRDIPLSMTALTKPQTRFNSHGSTIMPPALPQVPPPQPFARVASFDFAGAGACFAPLASIVLLI